MATQKDLARLAGVSAGTVSNVISGSSRVGEGVRKRVMEAIEALNYQPNLIARSLRTNRTNTLGIVIPDITMSFFPLVVRGAEAAVRSRGNFLIVVDSERDPVREMEMLTLLRAQRVDGILLVAADGSARSQRDLQQIRSGPPVVCLDRLADGLDADSVCVDDHEAAELGVGHLLSMGHRNIALLTGPQSLRNERDRLQGYCQALQGGGIPVRKSLILGSTFDPEEITRACRSLFGRTGRPTALFTTNGTVGAAAMKAIYAMGKSTPNDISFATIDEIAPDDFRRPRITSVVQPAFEIGYRGAEVLLNRVLKDRTEASRVTVRLSAKLVVGDSSSMVASHREV
jgi:DNA-binding LacI/PurR family transcriptional regulator